MSLRKFLFTVMLLAAAAGAASADPTPVPGGANQVNALPGKMGTTVFNGVLRIKIVELRDATPADHPEQALPSANQKVMIMTALLNNGAHSAFIDLVTYTLADADGVAFEIPTASVAPSNLNIQQGAAARQKAMFLVDKSYVPVKLLVQCPSCSPSEGFKNVRFSIPASASH